MNDDHDGTIPPVDPTWPPPSYPQPIGEQPTAPQPLVPPLYDPAWFAAEDTGTATPARVPRRGGRVALIAGMTAVSLAAVGIGVVLGHDVWAPTSVAAAQSPVASSGGSGSSASGGGSVDPFQGQFPTDPFGSGSNGDGGQYSGQAPSGSGTSPFGGTGGYGGYGNSGGGTGGSSSSGSDGPSDVAAIAAKVNPALVDINVTFGYESAQGAGTGIVLTSDGEILTNNHVINGATKISVTDVGNGRTYGATVVGYSPSHDLAVLQLANASGLTTANLDQSGSPAVGQSVVAIGNAGGSGGTPTSAGGAITALDQSITASDELGGTSEKLSGLIQVDADVQPGDSGGSLVNTDGQVIGIDTAASSSYSFDASGSQGYAIPISAATSIADQIEAGQSSDTVHIGASAMLGIEVSASGDGTNGVAVSGVVGTAARQAGLTAGDVITSLGGQAVSSATDLSAAILLHHPGDRVTLGWTDTNGQSRTATVALASGPPA